MYSIEIVYPNGTTKQINMSDYAASITVAQNIFSFSGVPPKLVRVWDFGVNNDQNHNIWEDSR